MAAIPEIKAKFGGKWKEYKNENIDAVFKEMGASFMVRKMVGNTHPTMDFVMEDNGEMTVTVKVAIKTQVMKFKLDEETINEQDGKKMRCTLKYEDGKLNTYSVPVTPGEGKESKVTREIDADGNMIFVMTVGSATGTRYLAREE